MEGTGRNHRRLSLGDGGVRLHESHAKADEQAHTSRQPVSPGWLARHNADVERIAQEKRIQHSRPPDSIAVRMRALNNRVGIRETNLARAALATTSPRRIRSPHSSSSISLLSNSSPPRSSSPRSPRHETATETQASTYRVSQRASLKDLDKRISGADYVRSLQSLESKLKHPSPMIQLRARNTVDSLVRKQSTSPRSSRTGRLSGAEFIKQLQDPSLRESDRSGASQPQGQKQEQQAVQWSETVAEREAPIPTTSAPSTPEREPVSDFHTPTRDPGPAAATTASSFSEWFAQNEGGGSFPSAPASAALPLVPRSEPEPELEPEQTVNSARNSAALEVTTAPSFSEWFAQSEGSGSFPSASASAASPIVPRTIVPRSEPRLQSLPNTEAQLSLQPWSPPPAVPPPAVPPLRFDQGDNALHNRAQVPRATATVPHLGLQ